jgi:uncharacterized RDD family membrane protein YckC
MQYQEKPFEHQGAAQKALGESKRSSIGEQRFSQDPYQQQQESADGISLSPGIQPRLHYAGVGKRALALLIDLLIYITAMSLLVFLTGGISTPLSLLLWLVYFTCMEAVKGATIGKMALGLCVVRRDGSPIGWSEALIRNLLRLVDMLLLYLVGAMFIWNSPYAQRLGDRIAQTVVVQKRDRIDF